MWSQWGGSERGEGHERELQRIEMLPTPKVTSLDMVRKSPVSAGVIPIGSVRLDFVSVAQFSEDILVGKWQPVQHENHIPGKIEFFYLIVEDGRGDPLPSQKKFRLLSTPHRDAGGVKWLITLERISEDLGRDGKSKYLSGTE